MKAYPMTNIVEVQEAISNKYAMYKDLDLLICVECAHWKGSRDREPCNRCVLLVSKFEEKEEAI